jgi:hypothetical protein
MPIKNIINIFFIPIHDKNEYTDYFSNIFDSFFHIYPFDGTI